MVEDIVSAPPQRPDPPHRPNCLPPVHPTFKLRVRLKQNLWIHPCHAPYPISPSPSGHDLQKLCIRQVLTPCHRLTWDRHTNPSLIHPALVSWSYP